MKRFALALLAIFCSCLPTFAQQQRQSNITGMKVVGQAVAAEFGRWQANVLAPGAASGSHTISLDTSSFVVPDGMPFFPLTTSIPILIDDFSATETVTPSAVNCAYGSPTCTLTTTFANAHPNNFTIRSGTYGLQEAISYMNSGPGGMVLITPDWRGTTAMITSSVGSSIVSIWDMRSGSINYYTWTGSIYTIGWGVNVNGGLVPTSITSVSNINNRRNCNAFNGATADVKITACIANLPSTGGIADAGGMEGTQTIAADVLVGSTGKPVVLILNAGATYNMGGFSFKMASGSALLGDNICNNAGQCLALVKNAGTAPAVSVAGITGSTHVQGVVLENFHINGAGRDGDGILLNAVDSIRINNVSVYNGAAGSALDVTNDAWDTWVTNSAFFTWGDFTHPTINLLAGSYAITDNHWVSLQLGENGNGNPILITDANVIQQRFVDVKNHTTGGVCSMGTGAMPYMWDFHGYRSDLIGVTFQADTACATGGMLRIYSADNRMIGGGFTDVSHGDAIHLIGTSAQLIVQGVGFSGGGSGAAIVTESSFGGSGQLTVSSISVNGLPIGVDATLGSGTVNVGMITPGTGVTNPFKAGASQAYPDFNMGYGTAQFGGTSGPITRNSTTFNQTLIVGGRTATNVAGYQNMYLTPKFGGGSGQINESITMGTSGLAGVGATEGSSIEHLDLWCYVVDPNCVQIMGKTANTALGTSAILLTVSNNGQLILPTASNCSSSVGTCSSAPSGAVAIAAGTTSAVVSTAAVNANSQILITFDESLGTKLGVTCNTSSPSEAAQYLIFARSASTSFTVKTNVAPTTNPACLSYYILN